MVSSASATQVAGYTIVRVLARGPRATLLLAHHDGEPRVLRLAAAGRDPGQIDREVEARSRAPREHAAALVDLATSDTGEPIVVTEHLPGPRLDELLDCRAADLSAGEAVTLIVPLLEAVAEAHDRGLTFGGLAVEGIRLRPDGAPVITRFSAACAGAALPPHLRDRDAQYRVDRDSALTVAAVIARQVVAPGGGELVAVVDRGRARDAALTSIASEVFDCAPAAPVRAAPLTVPAADAEVAPAVAVDADGSRPRQLEGATPLPGSPVSGAEFASMTRPSPGKSLLEPLLRRAALPESLVQSTLRAEERLVALTAAVRAGRSLRVTPRAVWPRTARPGTAGPRTLRPRTVVIGATGAVSVILSLLILGAGDAHDGAGSPGEPMAPEAWGAPTASSRERDGSAEPTPPDLAGRREPPELHESPKPEQWGEVVGTLVARWLSCRDGGSPAACAHESTQKGSSAEAALMEAGESVPRALQEWSASGGELVVLERMGAAVIVDLVGPETTTASLLLMRNEAGWRVRDVLVELRG